MKRHTKQKAKRQKFQRLILIFTIFLLCAGGVYVVQATPGAQRNSEMIRVKCYKSIEVRPGDSLWSIAKEHKTAEYSSIYAYIEDIYQLNHLTSENLTAGTHLMITCYEDFEKDFFANQYE